MEDSNWGGIVKEGFSIAIPTSEPLKYRKMYGQFGGNITHTAMTFVSNTAYENGIYRQDDDKITIVYDDQRIESYIIQNNHLVLLDDNNIADDDYTLSRQ